MQYTDRLYKAKQDSQPGDSSGASCTCSTQTDYIRQSWTVNQEILVERVRKMLADIIQDAMYTVHAPLSL